MQWNQSTQDIFHEAQNMIEILHLIMEDIKKLFDFVLILEENEQGFAIAPRQEPEPDTIHSEFKKHRSSLSDILFKIKKIIILDLEGFDKETQKVVWCFNGINLIELLLPALSSIESPCTFEEPGYSGYGPNPYQYLNLYQSINLCRLTILALEEDIIGAKDIFCPSNVDFDAPHYKVDNNHHTDKAGFLRLYLKHLKNTYEKDTSIAFSLFTTTQFLRTSLYKTDEDIESEADDNP